MTSGKFSEIVSSSTLVPKGYAPNTNPLLRVVDPIPDPSSFDLFIQYY